MIGNNAVFYKGWLLYVTDLTACMPDAVMMEMRGYLQHCQRPPFSLNRQLANGHWPQLIASEPPVTESHGRFGPLRLLAVRQYSYTLVPCSHGQTIRRRTHMV